MREITPQSGRGLGLTRLVVAAAATLALTKIVERFPRR
jgi:hypothetical protein